MEGCDAEAGDPHQIAARPNGAKWRSGRVRESPKSDHRSMTPPQTAGPGNHEICNQGDSADARAEALRRLSKPRHGICSGRSPPEPHRMQSAWRPAPQPHDTSRHGSTSRTRQRRHPRWPEIEDAAFRPPRRGRRRAAHANIISMIWPTFALSERIHDEPLLAAELRIQPLHEDDNFQPTANMQFRHQLRYIKFYSSLAQRQCRCNLAILLT